MVTSKTRRSHTHTYSRSSTFCYFCMNNPPRQRQHKIPSTHTQFNNPLHITRHCTPHARTAQPTRIARAKRWNLFEDLYKSFALCTATIIFIAMMPPFTSRRPRMSEAARSSRREPTETRAMELPAREHAATRSAAPPRQTPAPLRLQEKPRAFTAAIDP